MARRESNPLVNGASKGIRVPSLASYGLSLNFRLGLYASLLSIGCGLAASLSFAATADEPQRPAWTNSQSRTVIGGDILHFGFGEARTAELARFKAESMAVKSLLAECSLAHRDTVIWDRYLERITDSSFKAYARAGLNFSSCEEARRAKGEDRKRLSNPVLVQNQDLYDQLEREHVDQHSLIGQIKTWTRSLIGKSAVRISDLEQRITELEKSPNGAPTSVIVIHQNTVLVGASTNRETRYRDCMEDYKSLMEDARTQAMNSNPPGNLASPEAAPSHNRALRKLTYCEEIRRKK